MKTSLANGLRNRWATQTLRVSDTVKRERFSTCLTSRTSTPSGKHPFLVLCYLLFWPVALHSTSRNRNRERTPDEHETPIPSDCSDWMDSDGEADVSRKEPVDNLEQLPLAERLDRKRKLELKSEQSMIQLIVHFHFRNVLRLDILLIDNLRILGLQKRPKIELRESSPSSPVKENIEPTNKKLSGRCLFVIIK